MAKKNETGAAPEAASAENPELQKRTEALLAEGYREDIAAERAAETIRFEQLIAQKRAAGLTAEQARSVAEQQIAEDRAARAGK